MAKKVFGVEIKAKKGHLTRNITTKKCPWLGKGLEKGKVVYEYTGYTYDCITSGGIAVSDKPDKDPFYQVPENAVKWD
jgi:hypothetical protein